MASRRILSRKMMSHLWGAHAPRVLVSAPRRNAIAADKKVRNGEASPARKARAFPRRSWRTAE